jgi:hypothetical protein
MIDVENAAMIEWIEDDWEAARSRSRETGRPIFLFLHAPT